LAGEIATEIHVRAGHVIVILEVINDGTIVKLAKENRRQKAGMTNDQIGFDVRTGAKSFIDGVTMPDGILEGSTAIVRVSGGASLNAVLNPFNAIEMARRLLTNEGTAESLISHQIRGDLAELGGKILVDKEDVHVRLALIDR
jgi:hypothetical protein